MLLCRWFLSCFKHFLFLLFGFFLHFPFRLFVLLKSLPFNLYWFWIFSDNISSCSVEGKEELLACSIKSRISCSLLFSIWIVSFNCCIVWSTLYKSLSSVWHRDTLHPDDTGSIGSVVQSYKIYIECLLRRYFYTEYYLILHFFQVFDISNSQIRYSIQFYPKMCMAEYDQLSTIIYYKWSVCANENLCYIMLMSRKTVKKLRRVRRAVSRWIM